MARWLELLSEFEYQVIHCPGAQHTNADSLSRRPCPQCGMSTSIETVAESNTTTTTMVTVESCLLPTWSIEVISDVQNADADIKQVAQWLKSNSIPNQCPKEVSPNVQTLWNQRKQLVLENGTFYRKWKDIPGGGFHPIVLPVKLAPDILSGLHDSLVGGHMGAKKTLEKVRSWILLAWAKTICLQLVQ